MKPLKLNENDTDEYVAEQCGIVGPLVASDSNAGVATSGTNVEGATVAFVNSRTADDAAQQAAKTATETKNTKKTDGIKFYNLSVDKVVEVYPGDATHQKALGFKMSKDPASKGQCEKIVGGKGSQFIHNGFASLKWKSLLAEASYYVIEEAIGDPAVEANWYAANLPHSESAHAVVKPKTLNVPVWWRVTGWNAAGEGIAPSDPFGGDPIH